MKNLLILILCILCQKLVAQQSTEKWNDLYKRYEYYNSQNYMTGYKQYNNLKEQWEYFSTVNNTGYKPNTAFKDENFDLLERVMKVKQNKYDYNKKRIQNKIDEINYKLDELDPTGVKRAVFNEVYVQELNSTRPDLSKNNKTESIINWLHESYLSVRSD